MFIELLDLLNILPVLVDRPESEPAAMAGSGQTKRMLQEESEATRRDNTFNMSRLRSSSIEIKEKGAEFLREQLDAAQQVLLNTIIYAHIFTYAHIRMSINVKFKTGQAT